MKKRKPHLYKGLPLVDASPGAQLTLDVTKADVSGARRNDPARCAAALAGQRIFKTDVVVHLSRTYVKDNKRKVWVRYRTPESVSREIVSFDRASQFVPGTYTLRGMSVSEQLGVHRGKSTAKTGAAGRAPVHLTANVRESAKQSGRPA